MPRTARVLVSLVVAAALAGCAPSTPPPDPDVPDDARPSPAATGLAPAAGPAVLRLQILAAVPHDRSAFTQGLEVSDGVLLEGTGLRGRSQLRELDPATGALRRTVDLPPQLFGEGITVDDEATDNEAADNEAADNEAADNEAADSEAAADPDDPDDAGRDGHRQTVWQLTWTDRVALARDRATLAVVRTVPLEGEGWGICHHPGPGGGSQTGDGDRGGGGGRLVTSDGSERLTVRDRATFAPVTTIRVTAAGQPVTGLNELECTPEGIWANVWPTHHLVRIDPATGAVTARVDATGLLPPDQRAGSDVLNGIAAIPGTDQYWITGKLWPTTFRVRFVPD